MNVLIFHVYFETKEHIIYHLLFPQRRKERTPDNETHNILYTLCSSFYKLFSNFSYPNNFSLFTNFLFHFVHNMKSLVLEKN